MKKTTRADRNAVQVARAFLNQQGEEKGAWHETHEEIEDLLDWGERKAQLMAWLRRHMGRRLTPRERHCVELHFLAGFTFREIGKLTDTNGTSAWRAVQRGLRKLRRATEEDDSWRSIPGRRRRGKRAPRGK
jgi:DNA-directed RNA polymerase specialized sigma24 family protein